MWVISLHPTDDNVDSPEATPRPRPLPQWMPRAYPLQMGSGPHFGQISQCWSRCWYCEVLKAPSWMRELKWVTQYGLMPSQSVFAAALKEYEDRDWRRWWRRRLVVPLLSYLDIYNIICSPLFFAWTTEYHNGLYIALESMNQLVAQYPIETMRRSIVIYSSP